LAKFDVNIIKNSKVPNLLRICSNTGLNLLLRGNETNEIREIKVYFYATAIGNFKTACKLVKDGCIYSDKAKTLVLPGWEDSNQDRVTSLHSGE
jgi:hypothetical protein